MYPLRPLISAEASAAASSASTFSSIRRNASIDVFPVSPPSMSFTLVTPSAVLARATYCSFFALASNIFSSRDPIPSYSLSRLAAWTSIWDWTPFAASAYCCLRARASLARSSLPRRRASWARPYHSSPLSSLSAFSFRSFLCVAVTSEYVCRTLIKSLCMSWTAWFIIFSGLSRLLSTLFMFPLATRTKRSIKFIDISE
mmetsp:Transcript_43708/g.132968  ORF Transcript_43708/g.132968 Transcript_43708/m.132968 type:complete len:200 (+) Transcript_43708:308-907(+)